MADTTITPQSVLDKMFALIVQSAGKGAIVEKREVDGDRLLTCSFPVGSNFLSVHAIQATDDTRGPQPIRYLLSLDKRTLDGELVNSKALPLVGPAQLAVIWDALENSRISDRTHPARQEIRLPQPLPAPHGPN